MSAFKIFRYVLHLDIDNSFQDNKKNDFPHAEFKNMQIKKPLFFLFFIAFSSLSAATNAQQKVAMVGLENSPMVGFAAKKLRAALSEKGYLLTEKDGSTIIRFDTLATELKSEGFRIIKSGKRIRISGRDAAGAMYGGFELAEMIESGGLDAVKNVTQEPYMKMRGTKFNIPLDVRTPSYTDPSEAAQKNMGEMWNFNFWTAYIDSMAHFRYNFISLWNLHPFPSMVKVPDYPDVALDDVRRSTTAWKENYSLSGHDFDEPDIVNNYEVLKKITIDGKIAFWKEVMAYAKERNVRFYILTWNIFDYGTDNKYGIDDKFDNPTTRDYFRKSVKQLLLTYPDLAGVGLTTGENMYGLSTQQKEEWAYDTYGRAVLEVAKLQPQRNITLIHRQHMTGTQEIARYFDPLKAQKNIQFVFSFKYAQAHVYSATEQPVQKFVKDIQQNKAQKTFWTLRNDDVFYFRWGGPGFVREFIENIPYDVSEGYYYGSDQYVWGREFLSKNNDGPREIELAKQWYHFMIWGRLGYNPKMTDADFIAILQHHFADTDAKALFTAWQNASMIYPLVTGFHWGALDFQWYIESSQSRPDPANTPSGFHDVNRFITLKPHPKSGNISIPDYVESTQAGKTPVGTTPFQVAESINNKADSALNWVSAASKPGMSKELNHTIDDIQSMAYLGKYYAHKIIAATNLALFRKTTEKEYQEKTLENLKSSALYWRYYTSVSLASYQNPLWTNRVGHVDWKETYRYVLYDITTNGGETDVRSMVSTPGGTVLEAEDIAPGTAVVNTKIPGFTGKGYLELRDVDEVAQVTFKYNAPADGLYSLQFRYSMKRQWSFDSPVKINGEEKDTISFWPSGGANSWVWDRADVQLKKGENSIDLYPTGSVLLDNMNVARR